MTFANPLPWWALIGVLVAAAALAWYAYAGAPLTPRRRLTLSALRLATFAVLIALLLRPIAARSPDEAADAVVAILVDTSRSMGIEDADGGRRIDRARELVTGELLPSLSPRFQTEVLAFGDGLEAVPPDRLHAGGRRSDLTAALRAVAERYRGRAVAGVVVISDGGDTSAGSGDDAAAVPIFPIGVGSAVVERDREVAGLTAAEAVLDDSRLDLAVTAVSAGYGREPIELRLLENGRPIEVRRIVPAADRTPVNVVFQVAPGRGAPTLYAVEIPAAANELVPENNARSVLVQPPARARRVLLVQGSPGFEHSFLRRALAVDSGLQVDSVVRKGKNEQGADTFYIQAAAARSAALATGYPARVEDLFAYDAIVLANIEGAAFTSSQLEATRQFVGRRGGGLLVLGAQSFLRRGLHDTPLEELLPLDLDDRGRGVLPASQGPAAGANRVRLTSAGQSHPIMQLGPSPEQTATRWDAVPALAAIAPLGGPRPGASVLAVTNGPGGAPRALVAVQRYGDGRSMLFAGEASWRWRMLLPATDRSYDTFWRQAIRWLSVAATDPVAFVPSSGAAPGETASLRIQVRDAAFAPAAGATVSLRIAGPSGRTETVAAALDTSAADAPFVAKFLASDAGIFQLTADVRRHGLPDVTATSALLVGGADPEMADPRLNLRVLERLAAASGGRMIEPGRSAGLADDLRRALPPETRIVRRDLWHNGWSFALVVSLLACEWLVRRRWGLR